MVSHISVCIWAVFIYYSGWSIWRSPSLTRTFIWKSGGPRGPPGMGLGDCQCPHATVWELLLRINGVAWICTVPILWSDTWRLCSSPSAFTPSPLQTEQLSFYLFYVLEAFVWKEGPVSKSVWNSPTSILGYWRAKDLRGDWVIEILSLVFLFLGIANPQTLRRGLWDHASALATQQHVILILTVSAQENGIIWFERFNATWAWSWPAQGGIQGGGRVDCWAVWSPGGERQALKASFSDILICCHL